MDDNTKAWVFMIWMATLAVLIYGAVFIVDALDRAAKACG